MGKYSASGTNSCARSARKEVPMTFTEIERIIGAQAASEFAAISQHGGATMPSNNVMTKVWLECGIPNARRST